VIDAGVDTANNYVWANITKLSEFAIAGEIYQEQKNNAPSGGGGGGGGGGGPSGENQSNIIVMEKYDLSIYKDKVTSFRFTKSDNPVLYVNITGNISFGDITTSIEVLKSNSTMVNIQPPGVVYKNVNIWAEPSVFNKPRNIKEGMIRFKVDNSWIEDNSVTDLRMVMWDSGDWNQLETNDVAKDSAYTYYEASTRSFANFAITGTKGQKSVQFSAPVQKTQITPNQSAAPVAYQTKKAGGFGISSLLLLCFANSMFLRKRK
jgi:PGF-pre-PGF domain-containing protein